VVEAIVVFLVLFSKTGILK